MAWYQIDRFWDQMVTPSPLADPPADSSRPPPRWLAVGPLRSLPKILGAGGNGSGKSLVGQPERTAASQRCRAAA